MEVVYEDDVDWNATYAAKRYVRGNVLGAFRVVIDLETNTSRRLADDRENSLHAQLHVDKSHLI